jgi:hypothetical protein
MPAPSTLTGVVTISPTISFPIFLTCLGLLFSPPLIPSQPTLIIKLTRARNILLYHSPHIFTPTSPLPRYRHSSAEKVSIFETAPRGAQRVFLPADVALPEPVKWGWGRRRRGRERLGLCAIFLLRLWRLDRGKRRERRHRKREEGGLVVNWNDFE